MVHCWVLKGCSAQLGYGAFTGYGSIGVELLLSIYGELPLWDIPSPPFTPSLVHKVGPLWPNPGFLNSQTEISWGATSLSWARSQNYDDPREGLN